MRVFSTEKQKIGELGENIACNFLSNHGFGIVERNFSMKWGEIDIIAEKSKTTHFIEVKSVSRESFATIPHETIGYRPEEQVHLWKQKKIMRTIESYLQYHEIGEWQFDVVCVFINHRARIARVHVIEDVILA